MWGVHNNMFDFSIFQYLSCVLELHQKPQNVCTNFDLFFSFSPSSRASFFFLLLLFLWEIVFWIWFGTAVLNECRFIVPVKRNYSLVYWAHNGLLPKGHNARKRFFCFARTHTIFLHLFVVFQLLPFELIINGKSFFFFANTLLRRVEKKNLTRINFVVMSFDLLRIALGEKKESETVNSSS